MTNFKIIQWKIVDLCHLHLVADAPCSFPLGPQEEEEEKGPQLQQSRLFHSWPPLAMYLYWGVFIWYTKYIWRLCWLFGSVQCVFLVLWVVFGILDGVFRSFHPPALSTAATSAPRPFPPPAFCLVGSYCAVPSRAKPIKEQQLLFFT